MSRILFVLCLLVLSIVHKATSQHMGLLRFVGQDESKVESFMENNYSNFVLVEKEVDQDEATTYVYMRDPNSAGEPIEMEVIVQYGSVKSVIEFFGEASIDVVASILDAFAATPYLRSVNTPKDVYGNDLYYIMNPESEHGMCACKFMKMRFTQTNQKKNGAMLLYGINSITVKSLQMYSSSLVRENILRSIHRN